MSFFHGLICIIWIASMVCLIASIPFIIWDLIGISINIFGKIRIAVRNDKRVIAFIKYLECVHYCIKKDPAWSLKYLKWCRGK